MSDSPHLPASFTKQCREIIEKLDRVAGLRPRELETEVDQIERDMVRLRDELIKQLRNPPASRHSLPRLDAVNTALSLVVSVEYPVTSIQRSALEQARDVLQKLLAK